MHWITCEQFDKISHLHRLSTAHSEANLSRDIARIVDQLHNKSKVFEHICNRQHNHFDKINTSIMATAKGERKAIKQWMQGHLKKIFKSQ